MNRIKKTRGFKKAVTTMLAVMPALFALVANPPLALAADELHEISWGHPSPDEIQNFVVYISPESGSIELARQVDVGVPAGETLGSIRLYSAIVVLDEDDFIAVAARGRNGLISPPSTWGRVQPSAPGQPVLVSP